MCDNDPICRRHARLEREIAIIGVHHDVVGDDVLHGLRRLPHLGDRSFESPVGEGIDGEIGFVSNLNAADVAFAHIGVDLHFAEVSCDQKQSGGLEAGRYGLANGDIARDHGAVHRRDDGGVAEIDLRRLELGLALLDARLVNADLRARLVEQTLRAVEGVLRHRVGGGEAGVTLIGQLRIAEGGLVFFELRLGLIEIGFALVDHRLVGARIDLRTNLALLDQCIVVAGDVLHDAGYVGADDDGEHWIDRAGGGHRAGDVATGDGGSGVTYAATGADEPPSGGHRGEQRQRQQPGDQPAPARA